MVTDRVKYHQELAITSDLYNVYFLCFAADASELRDMPVLAVN